MSFALVAHRTASAVLRVSNDVLRGCVDGLLLGAAPIELLHEIDASYYGEQREYVDDGYNRRGLWPWEQAAVAAHFAPGSRLVVTAAGGGREVLALLEAGYDAVGFECNDRLRSHADALLAGGGHTGRIHPVERDRWPEGGGPWDGAVVGWGSYMLLQGRERRIAFLRAAGATLPAGAPVLVSFFPRSGRTRYLDVVATVGSLVRRLRRRPPLDYGDAMLPNFVHVFDRAQLEAEADAAGFDVLEYGTDEYGHAVLRSRGDR